MDPEADRILITVQFYDRAILDRGTTRGRRWARLVARLARATYVHVSLKLDMPDGNQIRFTTHGTQTFMVTSLDHGVPDYEIELSGPFEVSVEGWQMVRFTRLLMYLDLFRIPHPFHSRTCVTEVARVLGVRRRCRRPYDVLAAIERGDHDGHRNSTDRIVNRWRSGVHRRRDHLQSAE